MTREPDVPTSLSLIRQPTGAEMDQVAPTRTQEPERHPAVAPTFATEIPNVVADIIVGLNADRGLPRQALRSAVESWEKALPFFLEMLECYVDDPDPNEAATEPLFFIVHLFGQMRETRAYRLLMRFAAMAPEHVEAVLGDAITGSFSRVAASVFDGDTQPMRDVILNEQADEFIRNGLLEALALVTRDGRADRKSTVDFLLQCDSDLKPQRDNYAWVGWQSAISYLALTDLSDLVRGAFANGRIDPGFMSIQDFESDLAATRRDPTGAGRGHDEIGYFGDVIAEMSHWYGFSDAARQSHPKLIDDAHVNDRPIVVRSVKKHGRPRGNDPCPCGSGRKYKKCCRRT
jgi:uncharacterized protein DUF1186/SEC-C motif-containing protein